MLPDVVLLGIFDFYIPKKHFHYYKKQIEAWHRLAHVCRKWRNVVFGSPRRLNLRLCCGARTPVREMLDVWPPLPIVIWVHNPDPRDEDNIASALEHNDRICQLVIHDVPSSETEKALTALQRPFPELTFLLFASCIRTTTPIVPASFLGGSAPALQTLDLDHIPFPGIPNLLRSATHLVNLHLLKIPHSGYFSPVAMVTALSVLTRLESLGIGFESPRSRPDRKTRVPLQTRTLLPVLTRLRFNGVSEYLEELVARIDAPVLNNLTVTFFHQLIFDSPHLSQFISRTPKFKAHDEAHVVFSSFDVTVTLPRTIDGTLELSISCRRLDWQLSSAAQACSSSLPQALSSTIERLYIQSKSRRLQDDIENSQWLELFQPFTAVKDLHISLEFTPSITTALQELVGDRVTEMLPALQTVFFEEPRPSGPVLEAIGQFGVARQLAGRPIAVSRWERETRYETNDD